MFGANAVTPRRLMQGMFNIAAGIVGSEYILPVYVLRNNQRRE